MGQLKKLFSKFNNDWCFNMAAALSYNLLTALFPIAISILVVIGVLWGDSGAKEQSDILSRIINIFPKVISSKDLIVTILHQLAHDSGILGIISVLITVFAGSRLFILMENCFDIIYRVKQRNFWKQNLIGILMMLIFIIVVPAIVLLSTVSGNASLLLKHELLLNNSLNPYLVSSIALLSSLLITFILFECIYFIIPNAKLKIGTTWAGALISSVLLQVYLVIFPFYASLFLNDYVGQVGFAIIILVFLYYFSVILLLGAQINAFYFEGIQSSAGLIDIIVAHNLYLNEKTADNPVNKENFSNLEIINILLVLTILFRKVIKKCKK